MSKSIIEVKHAVLTFFTQENIFNPDTQTELVKFECDDIEVKKGLIVSVLQELSKLDLVRPIEVTKYEKTNIVWALTKPLGLYDKNLSFSCETAIAIADVLNKYFKSVGNTKEITDPTNITERDLQKLVLVLENLIPSENKSG